VLNTAYDKMPVGKGEKDMPFSTFELDLQAGDRFYLYTDGFADQFGGPKGKKFMYKQLNQTLVTHAGFPMQEQSGKLNKIFDDWKGTHEQVDDVCVIGIQYS
jgi:serine phosphatase RsbU (regulator of sigma subunit)